MAAEFDRRCTEMEKKHQTRMKQLKSDLDLRRKAELHELEQRKNTHMQTLIKNHERAFAEIRHYYNDVMRNNMNLINSLKVSGRLFKVFVQLK